MSPETVSAILAAIGAADLGPFTMDEVMSMLDCSQETVVERVQSGDLAAVKIGRGWIFPRAAFLQRLNELALEAAAERRAGRAGVTPSAAASVTAVDGKRPAGGRAGRRVPPVLPALPQH